MDDDDEIHSPTSAATGSPTPSPPNGRITVTLTTPASTVPAPAAVEEEEEENEGQSNSLGLVPIQQGKSNGGGGGGGGREDCWSEGATGVLIEAWGERYLELSRGNLKQKHWKEVADIVSSREDYRKVPKTDIQCKNRIDTVKKKYKLEKAKIATGGGPSKWPFFQRLDQLIGPAAKIQGATDKPLLGTPVGVGARAAGGSGSNLYQGKFQIKGFSSQGIRNQSRVRVRKRAVEMEETEEEEEELEGSDDSLPPQKRPRVAVEREGGGVKGRKGRRKGWGNSMRMLTQAILKFGEAYEQAEGAKLQQVMEMEKARMKFAKELELQRMQFFMKTQMEISQLKPSRRSGGGGGGNGRNHRSGENVVISSNNNNNSNNSDSDN